jgi:cytoskeletal protein CcmA (bactofilin family)
MDVIAQIGPSIHIKGEITANEPIMILGRVDGTIDVEGHEVTIDVGGRIDADVTAHTIVIGGAVTGRVLAGARIVIRETATIEGELSAPALSLADGATVTGRIEAAGRAAAGPRLAAASSAA